MAIANCESKTVRSIYKVLLWLSCAAVFSGNYFY